MMNTNVAALLAVPALALAGAWAPPPASPAPAPPARSAPPSGKDAKQGAKVDAQGFQLDDRGYRVAPKRGVFRLPWSGGVGQTANAKEIEAVALEADKWGPGQIIVLDIDSPGGRVTEIFKIVDAIAKARERHRVVVWVREAISAAAVTSMQCDEIYFRTIGALGAAMVITGADSAPDELVQQFKSEIGPIVERNGRPRAVFDAMVKADAILTYTKDPVTGKVTWHDKVTGLPGEVVLSDEKDNLTFKASNALDSGFSKGTADTEAELAALLGLPEWYEISDYGPRIASSLVKNYKDCETELQLLGQRRGIQRPSEIDQVKFELEAVDRAISWAKRCPPCVENTLGARSAEEAIERLKKEQKDLKKRLSDLQKAAKG